MADCVHPHPQVTTVAPGNHTYDIKMADLQPATLYTFVVLPLNRAGFGADRNVSLQTEDIGERQRERERKKR